MFFGISLYVISPSYNNTLISDILSIRMLQLKAFKVHYYFRKNIKLGVVCFLPQFDVVNSTHHILCLAEWKTFKRKLIPPYGIRAETRRENHKNRKILKADELYM